VAGPFTARWQTGRTAVVPFHLAGGGRCGNHVRDGTGLTGDKPSTGFRCQQPVLPRGSIAGTWRWGKWRDCAHPPRRNFHRGPFAGRWRATGADTFNLTWRILWTGVTVSSDSQRISGHNQYGSQSRAPGHRRLVEFSVAIGRKPRAWTIAQCHSCRGSEKFRSTA